MWFWFIRYVIVIFYSLTLMFISPVFQIHIALEDQTEENGTLEYIPGSHRYGSFGIRMASPNLLPDNGHLVIGYPLAAFFRP